MSGIDPCPAAARHTREPSGYLEWHEWAATKARTHRQIRCPRCGRYAVWIPRAVRVVVARRPVRRGAA